jgi:glycerophosphoryl diester phosphodiesterase
MKSLKQLLFVPIILSMITFAEAQTRVIAHRGAWKTENLPQNSIAALKHAIDLGCEGSEFDVHMTKDDVLVVNHDKDFLGIDIETSTYQELLAKKLPNGERIPTVEEYIKAGLNQKKTRLVLELKTSKISKERTLQSAEKAVALVKQLKARKLVDYICFDYDAGLRILELDPKADVAYLNGDKTPAQAKNDGYTGLDYHFSVYRKNPTWIKEAKDLGLTINAWTVNTREEMLHLIAQDVEFISTDEPELLMEVLALQPEVD